MQTKRKFLFQIGSIKSEKVIRYKKVVRSFYSKLVRLKAFEVQAWKKNLPKFLFQIGSIKSSNLPSTIVKCMSFYSKLVRLKGCRKCDVCDKEKGFYSKLVRLKDLRMMLSGQVISGFYSKLVRLKVMYSFLFLRRWKEFLFQIGSIKSLLKWIWTWPYLHVSIPNWFD